ncbi:MAG: sigma-70 family RNA polymerase sigma factor [Bacteroidota bacterium]
MTSVKEEFTSIILANQNILHKICRIYRDTPEDREDLFQEMIYQLWKSYPTYQKQAKITAWIYRVALNTALTRYRKRRIITEPIASTETIASEAREHPERERLHRAIGRLNEADKAIITLYLDEYRYEEIADILGLTTSHVGVKLHRIKEKLMNLLNPRTYDTG